MIYISEVREMDEKERIDYENMGKNLIKDLDDLSVPKEKVHLEVKLSKYNSKDFYEVSFKIGNKKTYVLKSIEEFIKAREELEDLVYGKGGYIFTS